MCIILTTPETGAVEVGGGAGYPVVHVRVEESVNTPLPFVGIWPENL